MSKKRVLTPGSERKKFPKPTGRIGVVAQDNVPEALVEVIPEEKVEVLPPAPTPTAIVIGLENGKVNINCGGLSLLDSVIVLRNAHRYLLTELNKELELVDNGTKEGTANPPSGSNT